MPHCAAASRPADGLGVERVALEVEEQVAVIGAGQRAERRRRDHLVRRHGWRRPVRRDCLGVRRVTARSERRVPAGLSSCRRACVRSIANVSGFMPRRRDVGRRRDRRSCGCRQRAVARAAPAASRPRAAGRGDATTSASHVAQRPHATTSSSPRGSPHAIAAPSAPRSSRRSAMRAASRSRRSRNTGSRSSTACALTLPSPSSSSTRSERATPEPIELVDVCRELHERGHPGAARELGVLHDPAAVCA